MAVSAVSRDLPYLVRATRRTPHKKVSGRLTPSGQVLGETPFDVTAFYLEEGSAAEPLLEIRQGKANLGNTNRAGDP